MIRALILSTLVSISAALHAQSFEQQYLSQYSHGTGWALYYTDIMIGDINLDSIPDVIFTMAEGYQMGYGRMKNGEISFDMQPVDFYRYGWWYFNGQLIDYDRDGDLDFITAASNNFDFDRSFIMENDGGDLVDTFRAAAPEFVDKARLKFAKFNEDDVDDLFYQVTQPLSVNLQDGLTGLLQPLPFPAYSISSRDYNHDGLMDFHQSEANSATYHTQTDHLYLNNGDYTFEHYETPGFLSHPPGLESPPWGDFDGDGVDDQFAKPLGFAGLGYVFKSNMKSQNEALIDTLIISTAEYENTNFVMDVTGDGTDDLIVFTEDSLYFLETDEGMQFNLSVQPGVFHPALIRHSPDLPQGTFLAMTGNGLPLLLRIGYKESSGLYVEQDYNSFSPFVLHEAIYASPVTRLDVDADGLPEILISSELTVASAEIQPDSSLAELKLFTALDDFQSRAVSSGDWNGDGHDDLFLCEGDLIYVAIRQPDSSLADRIFLSDGLLFDAHDFDRNGFSDLLISDYDSVSILYNQDGAIIRQEIVTTGMPFPSFTVFDPNADGYPDVALSRDTTYVFMNDGAGNFSRTSINIPGWLTHSTLPNSPYLFTVLFQDISGTNFYRPNLYRISDDGQEAEWIAGYVWIDTVITSREAWLINFDGDSMPDMIFNVGALDDIAWKALLINDQGAVYDIITVPDAFVLGAEDASSHNATEIVYAKGAKAYLLHGLPPATISTHNPQAGSLEVIVYPNPLTHGQPCIVSYESEYTGPVWIEVYQPDGKLWRRYHQLKTDQHFEFGFEPMPNISSLVSIRVIEEDKAVTRKIVLLGG